MNWVIQKREICTPSTPSSEQIMNESASEVSEILEAKLGEVPHPPKVAWDAGMPEPGAIRFRQSCAKMLELYRAWPGQHLGSFPLGSYI